MADTKFMSFAEATANSTDSVLIGNSTNGVRRSQLGNLAQAIGATAENCGGIVESSHDSNSGHVKFANGFLIQYGVTSNNGNNVSPGADDGTFKQDVTLPISYNNLPFAAASIALSGKNAFAQAWAPTQSKITITTNSGASTVVYWMTMGF